MAFADLISIPGMPAHLNYQAGYTKGYTTGFKVCLACSFVPVTAACLFSFLSLYLLILFLTESNCCFTLLLHVLSTDIRWLQGGI